MYRSYTPTQNNDPIVILGIDLGTTRMGFGVIHYDTKLSVLQQGIVATRPKATPSQQMTDIHTFLNKLITTHTPNCIAFEDVFFLKNKKTALDVASARGVVLLVAQQNKTPILKFTPPQVKQAVTGWGRSDKQQVQKMVTLLLSLKETPKPDDVADALAVAICCAHSLPYDESALL